MIISENTYSVSAATDCRPISVESAPAAPYFSHNVFFRKLSDSSAEGLGGKLLALMRFRRVLEAKNIPHVKVPQYHGFSHEVVAAFLKKIAPDVFEKWQQIAACYSSAEMKTVEFLERNEIRQLLNEIQAAIKLGISKALSAEAPAFYCEKMMPIEEGNYLMVRSSGMEDSKECPNTGRFNSYSYVHNSSKAVLSFGGKIISSFFKAKAQKLLLEAGLAPFASPPQLSFFLHELAGEKIGGASSIEKIPVSIVFFTHEPTYSDDNFHVAKISCTFGHGEEVVNHTDVASDTIYAVKAAEYKTKKLAIFSEIHEKKTRLAPMETQNLGVELQLVGNPKELSQKSALSNEMIAKIVALGKEAEEANEGCAMDMELVLIDKTLYVVQLRPIVRPEAKPSHLNPALLPLAAHAMGKSAVAGNQAAQLITSSSEILLCASLKKGEDDFCSAKHKIVLFATPEPSNSHPVVNFSSRGIPCLYFKEFKQARRLVEQISSATPLIVCPQSGTIALLPSMEHADNAILEGYFTHPAPITISLKGVEKIPRGFSTQEGAEFAERLQQAIHSLQRATIQKAALEALSLLKKEAGLENLYGRISLLQKECGTSKEARKRWFILQKLSHKIAKAFSRIENVWAKESPQLERLFHAKTLSALLYGKEEALHQYSLLDAPALIRSAEESAEYYRQTSGSENHFEQLLYLGDWALCEEEKQKWRNFLLTLENHPENKERLFSLIEILTDDDILPLWVNLLLLPGLQNIDALLPGSVEELQRLQSDSEIYRRLKQFETTLSQFGEPKKRKRALESFNHWAAIVSTPDFLEERKNPTERLIRQQTARKFCEIADAAIKTMKSSSFISHEEKISLMDEILLTNYKAFKAWFFCHHQQIASHVNIWPLDKNDYCQRFESSLKWCNRQSPETLFPSRDFSVKSALFNNQTNHSRHSPMTWEDHFTLNHQNQLSLLAILFQHLTEGIALPALTVKMSEALCLSPALANYRPQQYGIDIDKKRVAVRYNIPLRNHSIIIEMEQEHGAKNLLVHLFLCGEAGIRWSEIMVWTNALHHIGVLPLAYPGKLTAEKLSITWTVDSEKISTAVDTLAECLPIISTRFITWMKENLLALYQLAKGLLF